MVKQRFVVEEPMSAAILGESLQFPTSGRVSQNRFMKSAMSELIATYDTKNVKLSGIPTQRIINLYERFGQGGWGVILTGNIAVDHSHLEAGGNMAISREGDSKDSRVQYSRLASAGKNGGSLFIGQLNHTGRQTFANVNPRPFAASEVPLTGVEMRGSAFGQPVPLTVEQIKTEVIDRFVFACNRLHEAGFDGVEIHAGNGFLLSNFLSPTTNKRKDQYGGSVANRLRIVEEIYRAIRAEIPETTGFVVGIKFNSAEFQDGGLSQEEIIEMAEAIDRIGFDFFELSGGTYEKMQFWHVKESTQRREGFFIEFAAALRPHIKNAKVFLTGGFRTVPGMVRAIKNSDTDGISLARPAAAEPDLPRKILNKGVQSAALSLFESDFAVGLPGAQTQLAQIGSLPLRDTMGDVCYGISDFSDQQQADDYKEGMFKWYGEVLNIGKQGRMAAGVFEYKTRSKNVNGGIKNIPKPPPQTNGIRF
ncbi:Oxidored-FMN domain-containing protein [Aphelenchoides besseyi]|nr:Oxidored-FMN domain-containing protein [Aphelenchoides besseyi]KAI6221189.1 Oxidored-FMN domain-containing protein [Aphelenchoides besseyi]